LRTATGGLSRPMPDRAPLPAHVTMPLLDVVIRNSLDEDYQHVAAVRAAAGEAPGQRPMRWRAAVIIGIFALLLVVAVVQKQSEAGTDALAREALIHQMGTKSQELRDANRQVGELRDEIQSLNSSLARLTRSERSAAAANLSLGAIAGYAAVAGEGVKVTLDNAPGGAQDGVVRDEDLATLVDGLWAAGAEAISINGRRLTVTSGIRTAGSAILVHDRALRPPYVLLAIGDRNTLQSKFVETSSGENFLGLRSRFGFVFRMQNEKQLRLPAAHQPDVARATPYRPTQEVAP
jgi:uncharacterized protein YlxW (UPF0749 family)